MKRKLSILILLFLSLACQQEPNKSGESHKGQKKGVTSFVGENYTNTHAIDGPVPIVGSLNVGLNLAETESESSTDVSVLCSICRDLVNTVKNFQQQTLKAVLTNQLQSLLAEAIKSGLFLCKEGQRITEFLNAIEGQFNAIPYPISDENKDLTVALSTLQERLQRYASLAGTYNVSIIETVPKVCSELQSP